MDIKENLDFFEILKKIANFSSKFVVSDIRKFFAKRKI